MIKRIELPISIEVTGHELQWLQLKDEAALERQEKRVTWMEEQGREFEQQLNDALEDGYTLFDKYESKDRDTNYVTWILWKPDSVPTFPSYSETDSWISQHGDK